MCGIAGMMTTDGTEPPPRVLDALGRALAHRGPDGQGHYRHGDVAMVHNRLAIIDVAGGAQPIFEPGGAALVANGEIYNYLELRAAMGDVAFATNSDCETALHLYRRRGLDYLDALRGMYAIAIHDPKAGRLVISRDPFGIKPLYYVAGAAGFAFASEAQALVAAGLCAPRVDPRARAELLELQFTTGASGVLAGIQRVLPGETIVVAGGRVIERRVRAALAMNVEASVGEDEALARLEAALVESVELHQRSDVPYGMFLSGGIDSSSVLAMMARLNTRPVQALTAYFPGSAAADERTHARAVAAAARADLVEIAVDEASFWRVLPSVAAAMDDPAADYACVPSFLLAARARSEGLKVVLSGEGGDELFAGYGRYRSALRPWWLGGRAMRRRGTLEGLGVLRAPSSGWRDGIDAAELAARDHHADPLQAAQAVDVAHWLPNDLLGKLDRCLMAHGIEGRTPFLDPVVAAASFTLPARLKIKGRIGKWLLRRWLDHALPAAKAFAPKRGFTVPVGEWIAGRGARLGPLVAASPAIAEIAEPGAVEKLFQAQGKREGFAQWALLFYALWHRRHILGRDNGGDVFDCLAEVP